MLYTLIQGHAKQHEQALLRHAVLCNEMGLLLRATLTPTMLRGLKLISIATAKDKIIVIYVSAASS
jgi:hypothetical protein